VGPMWEGGHWRQLVNTIHRPERAAVLTAEKYMYIQWDLV